MFRRTQPSPAEPQSTDPVRPGAKGRPTPSRKEAEAAARARAKAPRTRKEMAAAARAARQEQSQRMREALKTGDERHLPARDRGPARRFIRDYVDVRFSVIELLIPIMVVSLLLSWSGNAYLIGVSEIVLLGAMVLIVIDMVFLRLKLRRELTQRFPEESLKGTTYYAVMRAMQMKFMRLPKPTRKIGESLPDTYR
ncbi:DUF3043 domain-containing protein [Nocardioides sp. Y6]|uniref:DUF3043 domain-containing protein n=1 Tax=Nocardioides malaquae TaxID=2773426 RepID=A0ABR9RP27_9ACTN|nr:DUF3043 domain-containing protein [Nocardioides malaquae]MBE7323317.1 DUF3043 domain-containing protein [Nocardioides malaquae]